MNGNEYLAAKRMDQHQTLAAIEAIKQVKAIYFRAMDTKQWGLLEDIFTEDIVCDYRDAMRDPHSPRREDSTSDDWVIHGRNAAIAFIRNGLGPVISVHHGHMPEIDVDSADSARGIWAMTDRLIFPHGPVREFLGFGHYHETYRKIDASWRIATIRLTRLRIDVSPRADG